MKKFGLLFLGLIGGVWLTLAFFSTGATRNSLAESSGTRRPIGVTATPRLSDKSVLPETPSIVAGQRRAAACRPQRGDSLTERPPDVNSW